MMTDAELTILSLVAEGPHYGYEIQQIIDDRGLREWLTIGFSSVYYILNKLERQKMLSSTLHSEGRGPARKIYEMTEAGHGVLQTAIANLLRQPRALGSGFELGLANLYALKPVQVYRVLRHHRDDLQNQLVLVEQSWQRHQEDDTNDTADHIIALYTHSIALMKAELSWMETFIDDWEKRYPEVKDPSLKSNNNHDATQTQKPTLNRAKMLQRLKRPHSSKPDKPKE